MQPDPGTAGAIGRRHQDLKVQIEGFLASKREKNSEVLQLLRAKVEGNEREIFHIRNRLIETGATKNTPLRSSVSPEMRGSALTKKNILNLKNDLKNFKNEMRRSLSANESGVRERLNSLGRSIRHMQRNDPKNA